MRDKQPPGANLPSIEDMNQSRLTKLPVKTIDLDLLEPSQSLDETLRRSGLNGQKAE